MERLKKHLIAAGGLLDDVLQKTLDAMRDCEARVASEMEKI